MRSTLNGTEVNKLNFVFVFTDSVVELYGQRLLRPLSSETKYVKETPFLELPNVYLIPAVQVAETVTVMTVAAVVVVVVLLYYY